MEEGFSSPIEEREEGHRASSLPSENSLQDTEDWREGKETNGENSKDSCYLTKVRSPQQQKADALIPFGSSGDIWHGVMSIKQVIKVYCLALCIM